MQVCDEQKRIVHEYYERKHYCYIQIKESSFESGGDGQVFSNANQEGR